MPRRLYFDWDYRSDCLWDAESGGMLILDGLPLGEQTRVDARAWAEHRTELGFQDLDSDPMSSPTGATRPPVTDAEWERSAREASALLGRIREDLGPEFLVGEVEFRDERRYVRWGPGEPLVPFPLGSETDPER